MALTEQERRDFEVFVATRSASLMRTAYLLTGNSSDAEDLLQTTLAKVFLSWARIEDKGAADAYARRALTTTQISWWRKRRIEEVPTAKLPEQASATEDSYDDLWLAIAVLPKRQRAVIVLRYYEDLSEAEIAETLGCSVGTVKSQASKAMAKLRGSMSQPPPISLPLSGESR